MLLDGISKSARGVVHQVATEGRGKFISQHPVIGLGVGLVRGNTRQLRSKQFSRCVNRRHLLRAFDREEIAAVHVGYGKNIRGFRVEPGQHRLANQPAGALVPIIKSVLTEAQRDPVPRDAYGPPMMREQITAPRGKADLRIGLILEPLECLGGRETFGHLPVLRCGIVTRAERIQRSEPLLRGQELAFRIDLSVFDLAFQFLKPFKTIMPLVTPGVTGNTFHQILHRPDHALDWLRAGQSGMNESQAEIAKSLLRLRPGERASVSDAFNQP